MEDWLTLQFHSKEFHGLIRSLIESAKYQSQKHGCLPSKTHAAIAAQKLVEQIGYKSVNSYMKENEN